MATERWFPVKHELPVGSRLGRLLHSGADWQIYRLDTEHAILIVRSALADRWVQAQLLADGVADSFLFGKECYRAVLSGGNQRLEPVVANAAPDTKADGLAFALSLRETRKIDPEVPLHDAIYVERYSRLLPTWTVSEASSDEEVFGRWLTGGVSIPATSFRRLSSLLGWLGKKDVAALVQAGGFDLPTELGVAQTRRSPQRSEATRDGTEVPIMTGASEEESQPALHMQFSLPGRPVLESFFREHVIDIVEHAEGYLALGIDFPASLVLHGPPGCGKSFAVERLVEYLDWPSFHIDAKSVGSPYIHETSKKVGQVFENAMDAAPAVVVIDEMESYLSDRQVYASAGVHHVEEVAEFLRCIPEANRRHVLVIGMTNRLAMIDVAILRRGRFDHVVEVGMPSAAEVSDLVGSLLAKMPTEDDIDTIQIVKSLTGRALSDTTHVVREAARLAARAGRTTLDDESFRHALASLPPTELKKLSIGFSQD